MYLFSYVIVTKNDSVRLNATLLSIAASADWAKTEVIIVDGNSEDDTDDIVHKFKFLVTKYIKQKGSGIYSAMNQGIECSSGFFINVLNCGDLLLNQPPESSLIKGKAIVFKSEGLMRGRLPIFIRNSIPHHAIYYDRDLNVKYNEKLICCADYMESIRIHEDGNLLFSDFVTTHVDAPKESGPSNYRNYQEASCECYKRGGKYLIASVYYKINEIMIRLGLRSAK